MNKRHVVADKSTVSSYSLALVGATSLILLVASLLCLQIRLLDVKTSTTSIASSDEERVLSCYYSPPEANSSAGALWPRDLDPGLCTHINVAFASVAQRRVQLAPHLRAALPLLTAMRRINPHLKILLSIGGAGESNGFSDMVVNHASRKVFIKSIKSVLRNYSLDGIDLDWEFPAMHFSDERLGGRERQHFSQLLREIRMEYFREKQNYLLTVAVAAPQVIVDVSYDVDQLDLYVDYVNVMTYDFHYFTKFTPFTGLNSPLYQRPSEDLYLATLNVNYTVHLYEEKGLNREKIVIGIPSYGHTFTLVNPENTNVGSPAAGYGRVGSLGFADYGDICAFAASNGDHVTRVFDESARAPYLFAGTEWISYEDEHSAAEKAKFAASLGLRGAMLYSLNADDRSGRCGGSRFPLATAVRRALSLALP